MVEISKMRGGNPTQKEEREAKKKSFMGNFVGENHKAACGFCCWERALEDNRSKSAMAVEDVKPAPDANSQASLPVNQQPAAGIAVVQPPRQNMEDATDLKLDDSKPAATITVHNNESKVPKREPNKTKHKGNNGMNGWWMGLAKGAKQKLFPLLSSLCLYSTSVLQSSVHASLVLFVHLTPSFGMIMQCLHTFLHVLNAVVPGVSQ
jgi:hypothetical protein